MKTTKKTKKVAEKGKKVGKAKKALRGKFVIVTGPSTGGKTTIVETLLKKIKDSARLITVTTRARRPHETHEKDYVYVDRAEFEKRIKEGDFFEYAEVYGNLYGSSKKVLEAALEKNEYVFAIIDVQGAKTLKAAIPESQTFFIHPGSYEVIERRITTERADSVKAEIDKRLETAKKELAQAADFDVVVYNDEGRFDEAVEAIEATLALEI